MTPMPRTAQELARRIDQTNLNPQATAEEIIHFTETAIKYDFLTISVMPGWIPLINKTFPNSPIIIDPAIGFPLGTVTTEQKVRETLWVLNHLPSNAEIDMVMNIPMLKSRQYKQVIDDISRVVSAAKGHTVKVIIEAPILNPDEIIIASLLCQKAGAHFVKTSTGFNHFRGWRPSTPEDVQLIRSAVGDQMQIKIAGGIKTLAQALDALDAGADRIGTAFGIQIMDEYHRFNS